MKVSTLAILFSGASARFMEAGEADNVVLYPEEAAAERYHIELSPGETYWVTEEEKWEHRRQGINFMDITSQPDLGSIRLTPQTTITYPRHAAQQSAITRLLPRLSKSNMRKHLEKFTSFYTRYYKSHYGAESSAWLLRQVEDTVVDSGVGANVTVRPFEHPWGQNSIIATIPGKTNSTVVIGAHQDSINSWLPSVLAAPGADDDGSGTVTILEAFRVLLSSDLVQTGQLENTVEFHWYSAEEAGLLGSQAVFSSYQKEGRRVTAMLQQDMTGFVRKTVEAGEPEAVGVVMDYVDSGLTDFAKKVITEYCDIPFVETKCGYACSDHASASKAGYPAAFIIESAFERSSDMIHSTGDTIDTLSFDHMLQHAKLTLGLAYELAKADFDSHEGVQGGQNQEYIDDL